MKIAIVAPSPVPFTIGGAENLFWGLQNYFNEETPHQCELIKLASREANLAQLVDSYARFSELDLGHFDCVISTKYPAWMVRHQNHVCYLLHRLRGLYDTYHFTGLPEDVRWDAADMAGVALLKKELEKIGDSSMAEAFQACRAFLSDAPAAAILQFPGPFSRWLIHHFDSLGLAPGRISRYAAISRVVQRRRDYFPLGVPVSVLYPPPRITGFRCGGDDYLFTVSRLDGPKRIGLLVEAMRDVKADIQMLIAGSGPDEDRIKTLAADDPRIKFLGVVNDRQVIDYYADALAVPFVPYDEDYGFITIEAMMSGKPVLTLTDSGGPNEFVRNGLTGFSVAPEPRAMAEKIDYLCSHRAEAREMGRKARDLVSGITWQGVVEGLLGERRCMEHVVDPGHSARGKKMVVAVTFPIFPPRGGGQSRVYHLYRNLAKYCRIEIVSLCAFGQPSLDQEIAPGLREIRIPVSKEYQRVEGRISESVGWVPVTDIAAAQFIELAPQYLDRLRAAVAGADIVVACHPYLGKCLADAASTAEFWLEAQDVEILLKKAMLPDTEAGRQLLDRVREIESFCWHRASVVFACAESDINALADLYGETVARKVEVPNGVSVDDVPFVDTAERRRRKGKIGMEEKTIALFMGSWHGPNIEAVQRLIEYAVELPDVIFLLVGSVCGAISNERTPDNVKLLGVVDDGVKAVLLGTADVALNPMSSGSGSNLKMLEYFASGIPVISTEFGARGIKAVSGRHYNQAELGDFPDAIREVTNVAENCIVKDARRLVEESYSWAVISEVFWNSLADVG